MAGTLTPTPYQTVLDGDGVAVSGAKIKTTDTGTGVDAATYTNAALSAANTNPIVADSAGRYVAYLPAGANFTFAITTSAGAAIETQTNIQAVPGSSVNLDIEGTVGEAVTAGQVLYLSSAAESPALTAGKWYLTDSDVAATSTTPQSIGVAVSAIAINTAGTIRLAGEVNSAGTVVVGTTYYVGATPGAIVSSAPVLSRQVGVGLTTSSLLLAATTAVVGALPNPITQDLLFTDNTYDIGKSGASRPRDLFASRNAVVGGTLGVSGISTFTADLVATGASMSFQDNEGVALGTGSDATIQYNGTNVSLDTQAVGSGLLIVTGSAAISGVEIDNTATDGDPTLAFTLSGTSLFTMGVDDGDSDKFKIGTTAIGTSTALTIDGSQNVGLSTAAPVSLLDVRGPTGTGAAPAGVLTLATNELTIVDNDQLGRIEFRSPIATAGTDAIVTAASIWAEANATFSATVNAADIVFATATSGAATEKMRILSSGNTGIGTAAPGKILDVSTATTGDGLRSINTNASSGIGAIFLETSLTSPSTVRNWGLFNNASAAGSFDIKSSNAAGGDAYAAGTTRMTISSSGRVKMPDVYSVSGSGAALYIESDGNLFRIVSARRYKDNINYDNVSGDAVYDLRPVTYTLRDIENPVEQVGFIAEDVEEVDPRLVVYSKEGTVDALHYDRITVLLVKAMQDQKATYDASLAQLDARITALEP